MPHNSHRKSSFLIILCAERS